MVKKKLTRQEEQRIAFAEKVVRALQRKAKKLGVSYGEYFVGIAQGKYPKVTPAEAEPESDD